MIKTNNENNLNLGLLKNDLPFYSESISDILISKIEETYANKGKLGYHSVDIYFPTLMFDSYSRKAVEFSYNEVGIYALPIKGSLLFYLLEENNKTLFDRESGLVFDFINNNDWDLDKVALSILSLSSKYFSLRSTSFVISLHFFT